MLATETATDAMARKPNYAFELKARAKAKADKREAKRKAKLGERANRSSVAPEPEPLDTGGADGVSRESSAKDPEKPGASDTRPPDRAGQCAQPDSLRFAPTSTARKRER